VHFHCQVCAAFKVKSIARKCGGVEVCVPVFEVLPPVFKVKSILMARPASKQRPDFRGLVVFMKCIFIAKFVQRSRSKSSSSLENVAAL